MDLKKLIKLFGLSPHPEGGFYREIFRSKDRIVFKNKEKSLCTHIYYLLVKDEISAFHRIKYLEMWHFYRGSSVIIHIIYPNGNYESKILGKNIEKGENPFIVIPAMSYQAAELKNKRGYALLGCTVVPGFEFEDFEIPEKDKL